jgi:hypothetical protein
MAQVRTFSGPNGLTGIDMVPGSLLPIGFSGLSDKDAINRRASIAGQFSSQLANVRVSDIERRGSGNLTLSDGTRVPYTLSRYTVNNNGNNESYDAVLAQVKTGGTFSGTTRWMVVANRAGELNMDHVNDFARRFDPRNGFQ